MSIVMPVEFAAARRATIRSSSVIATIHYTRKNKISTRDAPESSLSLRLCKKVHLLSWFMWLVMTPEERIDRLELRLAQVEEAYEIAFGLVLNVLTDPRWKAVIESPEDMAQYIRIAAAAREDQENHIAAQILDRLAGKLFDA